MTDLKSPKILYFKGLLFLLVGLLGAAGILIRAPKWEIAVLLGVLIWAFCRAYYFAFYVIQHYIDEDYRFAGLWDFVKYLRNKGKSGVKAESDSDSTDS